jgi:hypothetical protein
MTLRPDDGHEGIDFGLVHGEDGGVAASQEAAGTAELRRWCPRWMRRLTSRSASMSDTIIITSLSWSSVKRCPFQEPIGGLFELLRHLLRHAGSLCVFSRTRSIIQARVSAPGRAREPRRMRR